MNLFENGIDLLVPGGFITAWHSFSVIIFFPISEYSYELIIFLLNKSITKFNNEIGKYF